MSLALHLTSLDTLHHAYGISPHSACDELIVLLEQLLGQSVAGQPDIWVLQVDSLTIDIARAIKERTLSQPLRLGRTFIIVSAPTITIEAQHALLKVLEEPTGHSHIFLCVPTLEQLLPTVRSRLYHITLAAPEAKKTKLTAPAFLQASPGARIPMLKSLLEKKDPQQIMAFAHALEKVLAENAEQQGLQLLYRVQEYLRDRGSSPKVLLEHLATVLPVVQS